VFSNFFFQQIFLPTKNLLKKMQNPSEIRELIGSVKNRCPTVPPVNVETHGLMQKKIEHFSNSYAIALIKGEDLHTNAVGWSEYSVDHVNEIMCLWILILAIENPSLGSLFINVGKDVHPQQYEAVVLALARRLSCIPEPRDKDIIKYNVIPNRNYNKQHIQDVYDKIDTVREKANNKINRGAKKRGKEEDEKEEKEEEEEEVPKRLQPQTLLELIYEDDRLYHFDIQVNEEKKKKEEDKKIPADAIIKLPTSPSQIGPKVSFTVTPIPNLDNETIGYLIQCFQHDPNWNLGSFIYELISQSNVRKTNANNPAYKDPWPQYVHLQGTQFPAASTFTWDRWLSIVNAVKGESMFKSFEHFANRQGHLDRADDFKSPLHPVNVLTLERALKRLAEKGGITGALDDYKDGAIPEHLKRFRYHSEQVFWDSDEQVGLVNQTFPLALKDDKNPELNLLLVNNACVLKEDVIAKAPKFSKFKTNQTLIHLATEADAYEMECAQKYPVDYLKMYEAYLNGDTEKEKDEKVLLYQKAVSESNVIWRQKFCSVWRTEGSIEYLDISKPCKSILKFLKSYTKKPITQEVEIYDTQMDILSNAIVRDVLFNWKIDRHLGAINARKFNALFSTYSDRRMGGILYNNMTVGARNSGKSRQGPAYCQKMMIEGTYTMLDRTTDAADQTDVGEYDGIRLINEMDEAFVNPDVAKRHPDKVNMKKTALTEGFITVKTFEPVTIPGMAKLRSSRIFTQAQGYTELTCSNTVPPEDAIASRYDINIVHMTEVPMSEMNYEVVREDTKKMKEIYQVNQALSCTVYKAMSLFVVNCRKPFMGVWRKLTRDILERLSTWNVISSQEGIRFLEMMEPLAIQLTVEKASILNWHTKGISKHFNKPFESSQAVDAAPFLYVDSNIVLLTFTFMSSKIIKADLGIVLKALFKVCCNMDYEKNINLYNLYTQDFENKIRFKTEKNPNWDRAIHFQTNKQIIDLNKLEVPMKLSELARAVSRNTPTNNFIAPSDCEKLIEQLSDMSFCPNHNDRNGYLVGISCDDIKKHRLTKALKVVLNLRELPRQVTLFSGEIYKTCCFDLLKSITGLDPYTFRTFAMGNLILDEIKSEKYQKTDIILFLYIMRQEIPALMELERRKIGDELRKNLPEEKETTPMILLNQVFKSLISRKITHLPDALRILKAIPQVNLTPEEDILKLINDHMEYLHYQIILYGFKMGYIAERDVQEMNVLKRPLIEGEGGYFSFASEDLIPMLNNQTGGQQISIIQIKKDSVSFSPMAIPLFEKEIIVDAFLDSVICDTFIPGKRLLGWPHEKDSSMMRTVNLTKEFIAEKIKEIDQNAKPGAISRMEGLTYKRREFIENSIKTYLYGVEAGPDKPMKVKKCIDVIKDLDEWAAKEQHLIVGRKFSDILYTPKYIKEHAESAKGESNYPDDIIAEKERHKQTFWDPNIPTKKRIKFF
jgi:hypothetical protein